MMHNDVKYYNHLVTINNQTHPNTYNIHNTQNNLYFVIIIK